MTEGGGYKQNRPNTYRVVAFFSMISLPDYISERKFFTIWESDSQIVNEYMIQRTATKQVISLASQFKSLAIAGSRQSGKTTLAKYVFKTKPYVSLENPDTRQFASNDPRGFLDQYPKGAVLDEIQRAPHLFSYLQQILDDSISPGQFILTGSKIFLLQKNISQSLAGRIAYFFLLPFSFVELSATEQMPAGINEA